MTHSAIRRQAFHPNPLWLVLSLLAAAPCAARDVTFFSWSDPHYEIEHTEGRPTVGEINQLPGTAYPPLMGGTVEVPRGIIIQGDLIDDGAKRDEYPAQWSNYTADFGVRGEGRCRFPVFDGVGNHDLNPDLFIYKQIAARNRIRLEHGLIQHVSDNGYHYSWDWEDVHFVHLNLFCGDSWHGESDGYGNVHDPMFSRQFLIADLAKNVGTSGRPVVVIQHYRPIDENWWTHLAADRFHQILQDYNVILILVGHQGGGPDNKWRGIHWASSNGNLLALRITGENHLDIAARGKSGWEKTVRKPVFRSYETSGLPAVIHNGDHATEITGVSAKLGGKILYQADPSTEVTVYWGDSDGGTDPALWKHSRKIGPQEAQRNFHTVIDGLQPWSTSYYRCAATNGKGTAWAATSISFNTSGDLPDGWSSPFVGHSQRAGGGAHHVDGTFIVRGSGRDIGEGSSGIDNFQFACRTLEGDGSITARIVSASHNTANPKVGIMIRESSAADARHAALLQHRSGDLHLINRSATAGRTSQSTPVESETPVWLRLVRRGNTFTGYHSSDGTSWQPLGKPVTVNLPGSALAGLVSTAGNRDSSAHHTATFDQVSINQDPAGNPD